MKLLSLIWLVISIFSLNHGYASPLEVQIEVESRARVIRLKVKNNSDKPIDYHGGMYGGAHIEVSQPQGGMLAIDDSGMFAMLSLPPGKQAESRIYIERPHFNIEDNAEYKINLTFGNINIGGAGVKIEALSLTTDASGAIDVIANQDTKVSFYEATADINQQKPGQSTNTIPISNPASNNTASIKLNGALLNSKKDTPKPLLTTPNTKDRSPPTSINQLPSDQSYSWFFISVLLTILGSGIYLKMRSKSN